VTATGDFTVQYNCPVTYSYSLSEASSVVSFDSSSKTFSFYEESSLASTLVTPTYQKDITVTLLGSAGTGTPTVKSKTFVLTVKNPCVDPAFNSITKVDFSKDYTINSDALTIDFKAHFSVQLASICGSSLTFTAT
jgi:hypothetical protein